MFAIGLGQKEPLESGYYFTAVAEDHIAAVHQ